MAYKRTGDQWRIKGKPCVFDSVAKQLLSLGGTRGRCIGHQNGLVGPLGKQVLDQGCNGK